MKKALIYTRVSSKRQKQEGVGLEVQEYHCRKYAELKGYKIEKVFTDDWAGKGDSWNRPGISKMLKHMDKNPTENYFILFDDLTRLARDTVAYIQLKEEFRIRNATPKCLNFNFD